MIVHILLHIGLPLECINLHEYSLYITLGRKIRRSNYFFRQRDDIVKVMEKLVRQFNKVGPSSWYLHSVFVALFNLQRITRERERGNQLSWSGDGHVNYLEIVGS